MRRPREMLALELQQLIAGQGEERVVVFNPSKRLQLAAESPADEDKPRRDDDGGEDRFNEQESPA